jgi:serine phosphatase RsbU (regulator of sigma subunit)
VEKERLERELEVARQIQMSILPRSYPQIPGYDFGASVVPMTAVGGDFYDFIALGDDRIGVVIGDVTDHGVPSALLMALTVTLLRAESRREASPREVLRSVNRHLLEMDDTGMFVTILYGILDCASGRFSYARAGHEIPILLDARGKVIDLDCQKGQPVGLFPDPLLDEQQLEIPSGGMLFLYSDGATDATDENDVRYGLENLRTTLHKCRQAKAKAICDSVWEALMDHRGGAMQQDDVTILAVRTK